MKLYIYIYTPYLIYLEEYPSINIHYPVVGTIRVPRVLIQNHMAIAGLYHDISWEFALHTGCEMTIQPPFSHRDSRRCFFGQQMEKLDWKICG